MVGGEFTIRITGCHDAQQPQLHIKQHQGRLHKRVRGGRGREAVVVVVVGKMGERERRQGGRTGSGPARPPTPET
jgi:hypothetical protein